MRGTDPGDSAAEDGAVHGKVMRRLVEQPDLEAVDMTPLLVLPPGRTTGPRIEPGQVGPVAMMGFQERLGIQLNPLGLLTNGSGGGTSPDPRQGQQENGQGQRVQCLT